MEKRKLGNTDMNVSVLGFGGAEIGYENAEVATATKILNLALDSGLNVIDTAECYNGSEELIGKTVAARRKDYFLFTKCGHSLGFDLPDWDTRLLEQSIERSLKRLNTDRVDLLQLHSCSEETLRKGGVIRVLENARNAGKTRYIGYSGDGRAARYAVDSGVFDTLQTSVSIADQECIELTLAEAARRKMGVIAKRPIANAAWKYGDRSPSPYAQPYFERLGKLKYDFLSKDLNTALQTALRFTLSAPAVCVAIVGSKNPQHFQEILKMPGTLPRAEFESIGKRWKECATAEWVGQV